LNGLALSSEPKSFNTHLTHSTLQKAESKQQEHAVQNIPTSKEISREDCLSLASDKEIHLAVNAQIPETFLF
jgi:hypothetical protein